MRSYVLLLTATINPGDYGELLIDPSTQKREQEYLNALLFWLRHSDKRIGSIVFCDNSGHKLQTMQKKLEDSMQGEQQYREIEWLSFSGNSRPTGFHYGYAELGTIDYALKNSEVLSESDAFIKVTGRLVFPTLSRLLDNTPKAIAFCADCHRFPQSNNSLAVRMRTQLFLSSTDFYRRHLLGVRETMTPKVNFIEELLMRRLWPLKDDTGVELRFPVECMPVGMSASVGSHYGSMANKVKSIVRSITRKLIPSLWL